MATATVVRPAQTLRTRRDAPRPSLAKRSSVMDPTNEPTAKKRKLDEPYVRTSAYILNKFRGKTPSLIIHLHQTHFRFEGQEGSFALDSPMKFVLLHLRRQTVPHEMMEELLVNNVPFYDGCLIVEVHNHRTVNGKERGRRDLASGDEIKFSMHNYHNYITPSPLVPFPKKASMEETTEQTEPTELTASEIPTDEKDEDGPKIATVVLHPTELSRHHELLLLAKTPASEMKNKRRGTEGTTPSSAVPPTPQLTRPPTPLGSNTRGAGNQGNKMCLEGQEFYDFQSDLLVATEPPLYLEPVDNPQDAQRVLDMLAHPLHSESPPSSKTRKRTTAEMAADDAQAAESERRMLIMDERIKPSGRTGAGTTSNDTQGTAASLVHSRFKTIQMVRVKHEEQERYKKEEEARVALERRQQEEAAQIQQQQQQQMRQMQQNKQREMMAARARQQQLQHEQLRAQQMAQAQQAAQMGGQNHAHPQQNNMIPNQSQANFPHQVTMSQSSPIVRQHTPMTNSSPMVPQNGFPMTATSSQGAGSPQRPTSAAMVNPNVAMARQASQQQHGSRNGTPQMAQGTPNLQQAQNMARQISQTPRMNHASPVPGTPASGNMANMPMQTPQQSHMTPEQMAMLQAQRQNMQNQAAGAMQAGSPNQQNAMAAMTPEQIQNIRQYQAARTHAMMQAQAAQQQGGGNPQQMQAFIQQRQAMAIRQQQAFMQQQRLMQQNANSSQAGSPQSGGGMMTTPQMGHAHPQQANGEINGNQQLTQQQQQALRAQQMTRQATAQLQQLAAQYGGPLNIPPQVVSTLSQPAQILIRQQHQRHQAVRAQQLRAQQAQNAGQAVVGSSGGDPEYMQTLRNHQAMLMAQAGGQGSPIGNMQGLNMAGGNMNASGMQQAAQFAGQGQGNNDLSQQFAAMQNALQRPNPQSGGAGMQ